MILFMMFIIKKIFFKIKKKNGLHGKIIITIVPNAIGIQLLVLLICNNTDMYSNKLVITSSIGLCYGDSYLHKY